MRIQSSYNQSFTDPYSFQAQEHDDEVKGDGNSVNYKYRMHDPRLGRFFAIDPLVGKYPWNSPYAFSENRLFDCRELEGLEAIGSIKNGVPVHQAGFNINIRGSGSSPSVDITVSQNANGGSLAIDQKGFDALISAGYTAKEEKGEYYGTPRLSTDPTQSMRLSLGGTTVTSDHSGAVFNKDAPNKFPMFTFTPPAEVSTGSEVSTSTTTGSVPANGGYISPSSPSIGTINASDIAICASSIQTSNAFDFPNVVASAPPGVARTIDNVTAFANSAIFNASSLASLNTAANAGSPVPIKILPMAMDGGQLILPGVINYTDVTSTTTPSTAPTSSAVTITDLVP